MAGVRFATGFLLPVASLWWRELVRFYRQKSRVAGVLASPLVFWFLIGSGLGSSFRSAASPHRGGYLEYFFPGTLALILLFTSIFCMMSVIEDRREGFLLSVLVAPIPRSALVLGKVLGGATLALLQALIFLLAAPAVGIALFPAQAILIVGILFLHAIGLTGLGFLIAWGLDSTQGFHALINLLLVPLWMLSGALFPPSGASSWIRWVMKLNPLSYGLAALRHGLYLRDPARGTEMPSLPVSLAVTAAFSALTLVAALVMVRGRTSRT